MKFISPLLSDARASVGGATFSKNRGGNYIRAKVAPVQPRTPAQQAARANLATVSAMWKSLTASQIAGWNSLAAGITLKDSLGTSYSPTGAQLFVGCNRNLSDIGETMVEVPPAAPPAFDDLTPLTLTATSGGTPALTLGIGTALTAAEFNLLVRATPQTSKGVSYFSPSDYRTIGHYATAPSNAVNLLANYTARFGALVSGQKIQVSVSEIAIASGFQSTPATVEAIIT